MGQRISICEQLVVDGIETGVGDRDEEERRDEEIDGVVSGMGEGEG